MRCDKSYLNDVIECQGDLFKLLTDAGYSLESVCIAYMESKPRHFIDLNGAYYNTLLGQELFETFTTEDKQKLVKTDEYQDDIRSQWVGEFYAMAQWEFDIASPELIKILKPVDIINHYGVLHDTDMSLVVQKFKEEKGLCKETIAVTE